MDNWGEGVVPSCREERPLRLKRQKKLVFHYLFNIVEYHFSLEPTSLSIVEQTPSLETNLQIATETDMIQNQMRVRTPSPTSDRVAEGARINAIDAGAADQSTYYKKSQEKRTMKKTTTHGDHKEKQSARHDILVIDGQPPKVSKNRKDNENKHFHADFHQERKQSAFVSFL